MFIYSWILHGPICCTKQSWLQVADTAWPTEHTKCTIWPVTVPGNPWSHKVWSCRSLSCRSVKGLESFFHRKETWIPMNYSLKEQVTGLLLLAEKIWKARKGREFSSSYEDKSSCPWSPVMISKLLKCLRSSSDQQTCNSPPTLTTYGYLLSSNDLASVTLLPCRYSGKHP